MSKQELCGEWDSDDSYSRFRCPFPKPCWKHVEDDEVDEDEGFPAPVTEAMWGRVRALHAEADALELLIPGIEELEAIKAGASHPLGCFRHSYLGGNTQWVIEDGCELAHD